ncbi:UxaA family hydrolase [Limnochorda pilosa]|uniref:Flagellar protein FlgA n=1 Tax=Limnochorda pilosa TaxID=1555112 RepID=A0A0K2SHH8_LIMPI|nr:UxaA family hydrolase [Limnochorda pilosa]BAS26274.1 flagellar protein FlgA [Limnochorda pilosa]
MHNGFLVHAAGDSVGVAVVDIEPGTAHGVIQEGGQTVEVEVVEPVPLGHKVALQDIEAGRLVTEYGVPIGKATQAIRAGQHVHTHNLKSARWA